MSLLTELLPVDLGLPEKFSQFRPAQADAIEFALASMKPFTAVNAPTGLGKSLLGVTCAKIRDERAVYLTSTKSLQAQIHSDFNGVGMVDIRGKANYACSVYTGKKHAPVSCDHGHEHLCYLRDTTACPYTAAYEIAKTSNLVSTNYAYWLHSRSNSASALEIEDRPVQLLICDEAHNAFKELAGFLSVALPPDFYQNDETVGRLRGSGLMSEHSGELWKSCANQRLRETRAELRALVEQHKSLTEARRQAGERISELEHLKSKLSSILTMTDNWVWEVADQGVSFDCIWPGRYSSVLWSKVPKVLLLSATLWPYTLDLLGLTKDQYDFREFSNGWPPNRGNVYYLPTVKLGYNSSDADYAQIVARIDEIIDGRLDRKGIVHTVSYARMRRLLAQSRHARIMHFNETSGESWQVAERFRSAAPPAVLISPSYGTGWDFPYTDCEYQIIPKIPFPYAESRVMQERCKSGQFRIYCAVLEMRQMIGRGRRAADDRCETFILDKNLGMVMSKGRQNAAKGFTSWTITTVPAPPAKLAPTRSADCGVKSPQNSCASAGRYSTLQSMRR